MPSFKTFFGSLLFALAGGAAFAAPASNFGCSGLELDRDLPSIEGRDGVFFRINADLRMNHPFSDETVADLARLSQELARNGTTLIYVPIPTKSVTMPDLLPPQATLYGFDLDIATKVHLDILERLNAAGVTTVDARQAMRDNDSDELAFFKADFHWSSRGAALTARAIAEVIRQQPGFADLSQTEFESVPQGVEIAFSGMRRILQKHCLETLPEAETMTYQTAPVQTLDLGGGLDLFGDQEEVLPIALLGTSFSDSPINNFPGFLAEYAGLEVVNYAITGGNQFGAMTSYLTSREFQDSRPRFLVWENPIYNNLAQYGDQPMRELIAAASGNCTQPVQAKLSADRKTLTADLTGLSTNTGSTLFVDTDGSTGLEAQFHFHSAAGLGRTKTVVRGERLRRTGRFYMPLSGLWPDGAAVVEIQLSQPYGTTPGLFLCPSQNEVKS